MIKIIALLILALNVFAWPTWIHAYSEPFDWNESTRTTLGTYRGVFCDCADFSPDAVLGLIYKVQLFFRLKQNDPDWDTSYFYLEFWNEDLTECIAQIDVEAVVAINTCNPTIIDLSLNPIQVEQNFWVIINTERSDHGFPRSVADNTPGTHSAYSESISGYWTAYPDGDFYLRLNAEFDSQSLEQITWAQIKRAY